VPAQAGKAKMNWQTADNFSEEFNWGSQWKNAPIANQKDPIAGTTEDADNDGYSNWLEDSLQTNPLNASSFPLNIVTTSLKSSLQGRDNDVDGIPNQSEIELGLDPNKADSDGDSISDSAELLSRTDPKSFGYAAVDSDGDGLSDDYENNEGLNSLVADTDKDQLRDDTEIAVGSNPFANDTDGDGILDGREMSLGSDPTKPD
jgi:hypothetical protein